MLIARNVIRCFATALLALGCIHNLNAQAVSNASITGHVVDEQGAVLPGTAIKLTGTETGLVYNAATNGEGIYTIPSVPIGVYQLEATVSGFQTWTQSGIQLRVGDNVQIGPYAIRR